MQSSKTTLKELQLLMKKMDMSTIQNTALPEFGMIWKKVLYTVEFTRQPMNPDSVARVICKIAAVSIPRVKLEEILGRLRFIVVATEKRKWYKVRLQQPKTTTDKPPLITAINLPHRVANAITAMTEGTSPLVEALLIEDVLHWTVRIMLRVGNYVLHGCTTPGEPIALFSSLSDFGAVQGCVEGLGYSKYEDTNLHGENILSLLRNAYNGGPAAGGLSDRVVHKKSVLSKPEPAMISIVQEETLRATEEMEEPETNLPGAADEKSVLSKPEPAMLSVIQEESLRATEEMEEPETNLPGDADEKSVLYKPEPAMLSIIQEESLRATKEMEEPETNLTGDADVKPVLSKPEPAMISVIQEDSFRALEEMEEKWPGSYDDRYVERRTDYGRVDNTLFLENIVNLTIDSD